MRSIPKTCRFSELVLTYWQKYSKQCIKEGIMKLWWYVVLLVGCLVACRENLGPASVTSNVDLAGDLFQPDHDGDGVHIIHDNCPYDRNADQSDIDADGVGDVCDNCPDEPNEHQKDSNSNGVGDACTGEAVLE